MLFSSQATALPGTPKERNLQISPDRIELKILAFWKGRVPSMDKILHELDIVPKTWIC